MAWAHHPSRNRHVALVAPAASALPGIRSLDSDLLLEAIGVLNIRPIGPFEPRLPHDSWMPLVQLAVSSAIHIALAAALMMLAPPATAPRAGVSPRDTSSQPQADLGTIVFLARDPLQLGQGGGGGGNRQPAPIRHAQAVGSDAITLRAASPASTTPAISEVAPSVPVVLDALPLASGAFDQIGLPAGGVAYGTSTGPGFGHGVGTGAGTGIGSGLGPGLGPGSGGGLGGGFYRPGGAVSAPRVLAEVKPTYTNGAALRRVQGTVVLDVVVTQEGRPSQIRVVRSLDEELDQQAITAAAQWRFEPGRLAGRPVDVLVTIMFDFSVR